MERVYAAQLPQHAGHRVRLQGWLHRNRSLSNVTFLILRDRTGQAQIVLPEDPGIPAETPLEVTGTATANPKAPGGVEVTEAVVTPLSDPAEPLPFELFRPTLTAGLPAQLDHPSVALRHPSRRRAFEISAAAVAGFRRVLDEQGFTEVHTPKIVASATESGANVFGIDYFGEKAYLAQSPQFYKQMLVGVFERVYEVGPVFRAEPHDTTRHLAQYTSLDVEFGFITDHTTVMALVRDVVAGMAGDLIAVPEQIPVLHFSEAKALMTPDGEPDLSPAEERWLGEWARAEHGSDFLFVTGYPMRKRPFYTHPDPRRPEYSYSFDLLFRGVELATGGQRLHNYADYVRALEAAGQDPAEYESYLRAFRYGMPPHGGFAIGLERWTARLTEAANVRETTLFPRDLHRFTP
ncbi:MAG TPA: aspartate--tRNA(Asn) ligase [Mycobacteriales bacterium]|nr:aspartate--tRNA(Asn) ligase [Mycobacteriales bacterium]